MTSNDKGSNITVNSDLRQAIREYLQSCTAGYGKPRITAFALSQKYKSVCLSTISRRITDLKLRNDQQYIEEEQIEGLLDTLARPLGRKPTFDETALKDLCKEIPPLLENSSCKKKTLEEALLERRKTIAAARGFNTKWVKPLCSTTYSKYRNEVAPEIKRSNKKTVVKARASKRARTKSKATQTTKRMKKDANGEN